MPALKIRGFSCSSRCVLFLLHLQLLLRIFLLLLLLLLIVVIIRLLSLYPSKVCKLYSYDEETTTFFPLYFSLAPSFASVTFPLFKVTSDPTERKTRLPTLDAFSLRDRLPSHFLDIRKFLTRGAHAISVEIRQL